MSANVTEALVELAIPVNAVRARIAGAQRVVTGAVAAATVLAVVWRLTGRRRDGQPT